MGRRKIEIRAIKDDRNRSVTFLKRKGGLFKKAHELSVLCSVDVAVIIFGHNKKLYEFSSGDIQETLQRYQYYGQPHEHKGPADFKGKGGGDDDEDEDDEEDLGHIREESVPPQTMPPHLQQHNSFTHLRQPAPSASPPMQNGLFPRHSTPQPGQAQIISRPPSQNTIRRPSSHLVPLPHGQATPPPPQNGFAYMPNPPIYNSNPAPPQPSPRPQFQQFPAQAPTSAPSHQQIQQSHQSYIQEQRRPSQPQATLHAPPQPVRRASPQPQPEQQQQSLRPPEHSPPQVRQNSKSHSIFTPIDEGGSVLATFFGGGEVSRPSVKREHTPESRIIKPPPRAATGPQSESQTPRSQPEFAAPSRSDTTGSKSGPRPKLNLQIPSEASDGESVTNDSPRRSAGTTGATPAKTSTETHHSGIVLPPPSPSASAVLSASASGPPNPFARPMPPTSSGAQNTNAYADNRNNAETPMSALPSRFIAENLLPSPGGFYDWDSFGKNGLNSAILPSPLTFGTPVTITSPSFERTSTGNAGDKRKGSEERIGEAKKIKT